MLNDLVDLLFPRRCAVCGRDGAPLCSACVAPSVLSVALHPGRGDALEVVAAGEYADALRHALIVYKERGRRDLAGVLGSMLGHSVCHSLRVCGEAAREVVLVPIPSTRHAAAQRGGDHLARLARRAATASGVRAASRVLQPTRAVRDSAGLGVTERAVNLHGAFRARSPTGRAALLVDDIVTTGATLREAERALRAAGWPVCGAAVVASTRRRVEAAPLAAPTSAV